MKEFLKPTLQKVVIVTLVFITLSVFGFLFPHNHYPTLYPFTLRIGSYAYWVNETIGFPWPWLAREVFPCIIPPCPTSWMTNPLGLLADVVFSYFLVCMGVMFIRKFKIHATPPPTN